jgi:hypothetical protein
LASRSRQNQRGTDHGKVEQTAALLDVELLDLLAQIEALLRAGREMQREALAVRGVPVPRPPAHRAAAAAKIEKLVETMGRDHQAIARVLNTLRDCARQLHRSVRRGTHSRN